jgi:hypothetical protein
MANQQLSKFASFFAICPQVFSNLEQDLGGKYFGLVAQIFVYKPIRVFDGWGRNAGL